MNISIANSIKHSINSKSILLGVVASVINFSASAQDNLVHAQTTSVYSNPLFIALISIIILMLIVIVVFADVVKAAALQKREQEREKRKNESQTILKTVVLILSFGFLSNSLFAQTEATTAVSVAIDNNYWGLGGLLFYTMVTVIFIEVLVVWFLYNLLMQLLGIKERKEKLAAEKANVKVKEPSLIEKINASVAIESEEEIMFDHSYDGIRELDNNLPPWWKYGFYVTIVFGVLYLINYHITRTGKLQFAEYEDQLMQAKHDMDLYRKKAANLVDENNAVVLKDEASLNSGKSIYMDNCAACHGRGGEGGVGPNLTDDYWLHQGGIKDIFKTIKYGWPEKGMKAWQQDLGAKQIHEVSSYILSLRGTNPPNQKEKQGELYLVQSDSTTSVVKDTLQATVAK